MESTIEAGRKHEGLNKRLRGQRGASRGRLAFSGSASPPAINCPLYRNVGGPRSAYPPLLPPAPVLPLSTPVSSDSDGHDTRRLGRFSSAARILFDLGMLVRVSARGYSASFSFVSLSFPYLQAETCSAPRCPANSLLSRFVNHSIDARHSGPSLAVNTYGGIDFMVERSCRPSRVYCVPAAVLT